MAAFSLKRAIGPDALNKLKTCEFHFKECRNRQARKLNEHERRNFKDLCNALLEAVSPTAYEKSKEVLENFCRRKRGEEVSPELDRVEAQKTELHLSCFRAVGKCTKIEPHRAYPRKLGKEGQNEHVLAGCGICRFSGQYST